MTACPNPAASAVEPRPGVRGPPFDAAQGVGVPAAKHTDPVVSPVEPRPGVRGPRNNTAAAEMMR
jgi:hypothetical protein